MRPFFVANGTRGIAVIVSVHGSSTPVSTTNAGVAAGSSLCKAVTGGRQCTISAGAPPGSDDFVIKTYDAAPSGGGFSAAKQLAIGSGAKTIAAGKSNSLNVTVGGVVAKAAVHLSWPVNPVIDKDIQTVTLSALDADGNTIINDGWYSAAGTAVTMMLSATNGSAGMFTFSATSVAFAAPTSKLTYDSTKITSTEAKNGFTSSIGATPSNGAIPGSAIFTLSKPTVVAEFPVNYGSGPQGIIVGPDNALWFAENSVSAIGRISTSAASGTHPSGYSNGLSANAQPVALAYASDDRKIWFTECGSGKIGNIDPSSPASAMNEYLSPGGAGSAPYGITYGPDSNMWFTEQYSLDSKVVKFNASAIDGGIGSMHEYPTKTSSSSPGWITTGPDKNLWFTEPGVDKIGTMTTSGTANDFMGPLVTNSLGAGQIATGPDGALWFTEENPGGGSASAGHRIARVTTAGSITQEYAFTNTFTEPAGIVTGPDGALWFAEYCNNAIGRLDPNTKTLVEFSLPNTGSYPWGIIKGPDGALWFTEYIGNRIGKLQ